MRSTSGNEVLSYRDPATGTPLCIQMANIPPLRSVTYRIDPSTGDIENLNELLGMEPFESFTILEYLDGRVLNGDLISVEGNAYKFDDQAWESTVDNLTQQVTTEILVQQIEAVAFRSNDQNAQDVAAKPYSILALIEAESKPFNARRLSQILGVALSTVLSMAREGILPHFYAGREGKYQQVRFDPAVISHWYRKQNPAIAKAYRRLN